MSVMDFTRGLAALIFAPGFVLPDGVQTVGDFELPNDGIDEAVWNAVAWTGGSAKPTYAEVVAALAAENMKGQRINLAALLKIECKRRITAAYGENTLTEEILLRLRSGQTEAQDTERERLRTKCATLITGLESMTAEQLDAFDPTTDGNWA